MLMRVAVAAPRLPSSKWVVERLDRPSEVISCPEDAELLEWLEGRAIDLVVLDDEHLGHEPAGRLRAHRALPSSPGIVVCIGSERASTTQLEARRATLMAAGALAVISRDLDRSAVLGVVEQMIDRHRELATQRRRAAELDTSRLSDFSTKSPAMRELLRTARKLAGADTTVLICGETGTGKEFLTRAIHSEGARRSGPFVAVNCSAFAETLIESELFGHARGSFTGAHGRRRGCFELAHSGTLFLDEIGEMPLLLQPKLLRALQEKVIQPIGDEKTVRVDVRVIAATNRDLFDLVKQDRFRADLLYRLDVVSMMIPPLRERREDIGDLARSHVAHFAAALNRPISGISSEALELLMEYPWPGNVREMINMLERAVLLSDSDEIAVEDVLPAMKRHGFSREQTPRLSDLFDRPWREARKEVLEDFDRRYFRSLLERTAGNATEAARLAGVPPRSLYDALKKAGIERRDFASHHSSKEGRRESTGRASQSLDRATPLRETGR